MASILDTTMLAAVLKDPLALAVKKEISQRTPASPDERSSS